MQKNQEPVYWPYRFLTCHSQPPTDMQIYSTAQSPTTNDRHLDLCRKGKNTVEPPQHKNASFPSWSVNFLPIPVLPLISFSLCGGTAALGKKMVSATH